MHLLEIAQQLIDHFFSACEMRCTIWMRRSTRPSMILSPLPAKAASRCNEWARGVDVPHEVAQLLHGLDIDAGFWAVSLRRGYQVTPACNLAQLLQFTQHS